jgi:hypothetical protein
VLWILIEGEAVAGPCLANRSGLDSAMSSSFRSQSRYRLVPCFFCNSGRTSQAEMPCNINHASTASDSLAQAAKPKYGTKIRKIDLKIHSPPSPLFIVRIIYYGYLKTEDAGQRRRTNPSNIMPVRVAVSSTCPSRLAERSWRREASFSNGIVRFVYLHSQTALTLQIRFGSANAKQRKRSLPT